MHPSTRLFVFASMGLLLIGFTAPVEAQGRATRRGRSVVVASRPYFVSPFWYGYPWYPYGYGHWYPFQYPFGPYPPYGGYYRFDSGSAVRLDVDPKEAEVYVDGYYAGIVDDYDGVFQRLHLEPGEHEIALYREGYRTAHQNVYLTPRSTRKITLTLERLAAGDIAEPRPSPPPSPPQTGRPGRQRDRGPAGRRVPGPGDVVPQQGPASSYGTLSIRVQPPDTIVLVDGERWEGPRGQDRLTVELPEGRHRVEIQKDGYEPFSSEVTVRRGETTPLNVSLRAR